MKKPLIGITLDRSTNALPAHKFTELNQNIERLGFESVWLLDSFGREPFIAATYILANTSTLVVGTGVATVYGRDPTGAVQVLQTLSELYPKRFCMGLGASNPIVITKRKGQWVQPLPKMTAYLEEMAEVSFFGIKSDVVAPIYIAAHAPGLQSLAVKHAQGIMTWIMPSFIIEQARQHVGPELDITASILCVVSTDADEAHRTARAYLTMYLALPYYQTAFAKAGFDPADCKDISDRLIDSVLAWGTPAQIRERVAAFAKAGATRVVLNPLRLDASQQGPGGAPVAVGDWARLPLLAAALDDTQDDSQTLSKY